MTYFLDTLPLDFSLPATQELHGILAQRYYQPRQIEVYLRRTPLDPAYVNLNGPARDIWFDILITARDQDILREVVEVGRREKAIGDRIDELLKAEPVVAAPHDLTGTVDEPEDKPWAGPDNAVGIERLLAEVSTLLPTSFLERGVRIASSVARLRTSFDTGVFHGTAFRIGKRAFLTNHHVLFDWADNNKKAKGVKAWFDYELDATGDVKQVYEVEGDLDSISGQKVHDWATISAASSIPEKYPILPLGPKIPTESNDRVYIIQHPNGGPKQIGMHRNLVSHVDKEVIQYLTDTEEGSSGAPVFNDRWEVVALHHRWVEVKDTQNGEEVVVYRNQGRRIERVVEGLEQAGVQLG